MKQRLIDANGLIKKAYRSEMWNRSTQAFDLFVVDAEDVENAPTIDAEPVRHGRWYPGSSIITGGVRLINFQCCSNCGVESTEYAKYCPNCGAKMDAEVQHETFHPEPT